MAEVQYNGTVDSEPTVIPVITPEVKPVVEVTAVVTPAATASTVTADKLKVYFAKAKAFVETYSFEVFLVAIVIAVAIFALLFPRFALGVAAVVSAVSGWVAYLGLKKRTEGK